MKRSGKQHHCALKCKCFRCNDAVEDNDYLSYYYSIGIVGSVNIDEEGKGEKK